MTPAEALADVARQLARFECVAPIPLTFAAEISKHGDGITIDVYAAATDAYDPTRTMQVRHRGGVAFGASEDTIASMVWKLALGGYQHELEHRLCRDGVPLRDPHPPEDRP